MTELQQVIEADNKTTKKQRAISGWTNLDPKAQAVLLGLMVTSDDLQAMAFSGVSSPTFYKYKPRVLPLIDDIEAAITKKSWQVLKGSTIKAAQIVAEGLKQTSYRYRFEAAKNILDRVLGEPTKKIETRGQITVLGIELSKDKVDAILHPIESEETVATNSNVATSNYPNRSQQDPKETTSELKTQEV